MFTVDGEQDQQEYVDGLMSGAGAAVGSSLDVLAREGARRMLAAALQAEVAAYIDAHADQVDGADTMRQGRASP